MGYSLIAHTAAGSTTSNNVTTSGIATTGASLLVAAIADYQGATAATISDSNSNTWSPLNTYNDGSVARIRLFYVPSPVAGAGHTASASSTAAYPSIFFAAFSGSASSPFDVQNGASSASGVTSLQPGSITPGQSNELIITAFCLGSAYSSPSIDSGFTILDTLPQTVTQDSPGGFAYLIQGAAAAVNPTWSWTTSNSAAAAIASFKPATGGPFPHFTRRAHTGGLIALG